MFKLIKNTFLILLITIILLTAGTIPSLMYIKHHNNIMLDVINDNKSKFDNALLSTNLDYEINIDSADGYCFNTEYDSDTTYGNSKDINELYNNNIFNENILSFEEKGKYNYFQPMQGSIHVKFKNNKNFMKNEAAEIIYNLSKHLNVILSSNDLHTNDEVGSNFITLELIQEEIDAVLSGKDKIVCLTTNDYKIYYDLYHTENEDNNYYKFSIRIYNNY